MPETGGSPASAAAPDHIADTDLVEQAVRAAAPLALGHARDRLDVVFKPGDQGPVTAADLAVNAALHDTLRPARPGYGWLSEETPDSAERLGLRYTFIVDPIDGTRSFIDGAPDWAHSVAVADTGQITAAVVMMPRHPALYRATLGHGATKDGGTLAVSTEARLNVASVLTGRPSMDAKFWRIPPPFTRKFRSSLAYRLALVAEGRFDAMVSLHPIWEWDIAAGALLVAEAGGIVTDRHGAPVNFNAPGARADGILAAPPALHAALLAHLAP